MSLKKVAGTAFSLSAMQAANSLIPLLTWPFLARVLGADVFGAVILTTAVAMYLNAIVDYGYGYTATQKIARAIGNDQEVAHIFARTYIGKALLLLVGVAFLGVCIAIVPAIGAVAGLIGLSLIGVAATAINPVWFFHGKERLKKITIIQLVEKSLAVAAILVFVRSEADAYLVILIVGVFQLVGAIIGLKLAVSDLSLSKTVRVTRQEIKQDLKEGFDVFLNTFSPNLYSNLSVVLLGAYSGYAAVTLLDAARKVCSIADHAVTALSRAFFTSISRKPDSHAQSQVFVLGQAAIMVAFVGVFGSDISSFMFGSPPEEADTVLLLMILGVVGLALKLTYAVNYLIPLGLTGKLRSITVWSSVIAMAVGVFIIPPYGVWGAAFTIVFGRLLQGFWAFMLYLKIR